MKAAILVRANAISGAERRAMSIASELASRGEFEIELWLDGDILDRLENADLPSSLSVVDYGSHKKISAILNRGRRFRKLRRVLCLDALERMLKRKRVSRLCAEREIDLMHIFLDNGIDVVEGVCQLREVTSKEEVAIINTQPKRLLNSFYFNAVSPTVFEMLDRHGTMPHRGHLGLPFHNEREPGNLDSAPSKEKMITWAHRMIPRKNGTLFARAAKDFLAIRPDWHVNILGKGPDERKISEILAEEIAAGTATVGYSLNLPSILAKSSVFVSLIEPDNYPSQSVFEAMSQANALLLSDTGRSRELLFDSNGAMCETYHDSVLTALLALTDDVVKIHEWGRASKRLLVERFNKDEYLDRLSFLYHSRVEQYASERP